MNSKPRILIVDDEPQIARVLRTGLTAHGYDTNVAVDGVSALEVFGEWKPDLIVTDLAMPNMNGLQLCRKMREISQVPIIVLSVRGEEQTKIQALDAGADDYVTKPFGIGELLARIRALLRRAGTETSTSNVLASGDFRIDLDSRIVIVQGKEVYLTPKEYDLLVYFMRHINKVLTQRALLTAIWGGNFTEQPEYLRVFVGQLRKKIELDPASPRYIVTEPWVGYRFYSGAESNSASL
ncbi:MAG TPA: response regulator transcription factor [Pyrinomonadaceae bacterium]|jgi:two-component system KDP operon response regulator KdpE